MPHDVSEIDRRPRPARYYRQHLIRKLVGRLDLTRIERFLDIGCGSGSVVKILADLGLSGVGVDLSQDSIENARRAVPPDRVDLVVGDYHDVTGEFELVLAIEVLEHIEDDVAALRWMRNHTTERGRVLIAVPGCSTLYGVRDQAVGHYRRYDLPELREKLGAAGLEPDVLWSFGPRCFSSIYRMLTSRLLKRGEREAEHGTDRTGYTYPLGERTFLTWLWPVYSLFLPLTRLQGPFLRTRIFDANYIALCRRRDE
jgi:SAM-dependent methyltransferase